MSRLHTQTRFTGIVTHIEDYLEQRRQRRELLALDDRMLKDIGLSVADAERIAGEPLPSKRVSTIMR